MLLGRKYILQNEKFIIFISDSDWRLKRRNKRRNEVGKQTGLSDIHVDPVYTKTVD